MTGYNFGDVVLVPFPFTDQTTTKQRPAVVISSDIYNNQGFNDIIIIAITSQFSGMPKVGEGILKNWQAAGLIKPSMIKPVVVTLEKSLVIRKLGQLVEEDLQILRDVLAAIIGF
ncbi:type II toxin-antitoxin system PemK/MazF family toxin [Ancylothrix sp. C2]|uniref:type II toxin-antitoxin system PemK/MazF family toxin n=1 Tax=Ancylothrix sp. D3o TaxID=2953691 RepID=UPI0021BA5488|nr:type II toxin-antitoxin system PemK/MazF family toxin [Ancylothrix sp. D3o]MCT7952637.1 type II toxin-antitoxin system PemK/MazF family toxin [Ancylothrix sp. D3o]